MPSRRARLKRFSYLTPELVDQLDEAEAWDTLELFMVTKTCPYFSECFRQLYFAGMAIGFERGLAEAGAKHMTAARAVSAQDSRC